MRTIVVDDEPYMLKSFKRLSAYINKLNIVGCFFKPEDALDFAQKERVQLAILDITMPKMNGIELAEKLRKIQSDILIVFLTAHDDYLPASNSLGADDYIVKPYKEETIRRMADKMELLSVRQKKSVQIQTFGRFFLLKDGQNVRITGKAKEILALITVKRGREITNEELYCTIWESRERGNDKMKVYFNALRRLKDVLKENGLEDLIKSTPRGQTLNMDMVSCDYFDYLEGSLNVEERFTGDFLSEYSWAEYILAGMVNSHLF